jgi:hypothetical protein
MQVAIIIHIFHASPSALPRALLYDPLLERLSYHPLSFHHFVLATLARLSHLTWIRKRKLATTSVCWWTTLSPDVTLQSRHEPMSSLIERMKSIWL